MSKRFYTLSEAADHNLEDIFNFTFNKFGFDQTEKYLLEIDDIFSEFDCKSRIGQNPK